MLFEQIRDIICSELSLDEDQITMESTLSEKIDSLEIVELIMLLEEKFSVKVPDEALEEFQTVSDIVHFIEDNT